MARASILSLAMLGLGCVVPTPDAKLPSGPYIAVLSGQMPRPIDRVSRHSWIVLHRADGTNRRFEMGGGGPDPFDDFAAGDVMLHGVWTGSDAELAEKERCLEAADHAYYEAHPDYFPIPGPNSNTIVAFMDRRCGLGVDMPATAIGREYLGPIGVDVTEGRTGVEFETIPTGLRIGLREGVETHVFGLPLGVHFWPPGIDVPVNPGRIGFASDGHHYRAMHSGHSEYPTDPPTFGIATAQIYARAAAVTGDKSRALGLRGEGTLGLSTRALVGGRAGFAFGLDIDMGAAAPLGYAYGFHLYPLGVGIGLSPTGYIALLSGVGASGVTARIPSGFDLPQEVRLALDLGRAARLELFGRGTFVGFQPIRRQGKLGFDETAFGLGTRLGDAISESDGVLGSGLFFRFERVELAGGAMIAFVFGSEIDAGYSGNLRF